MRYALPLLVSAVLVAPGVARSAPESSSSDVVLTLRGDDDVRMARAHVVVSCPGESDRTLKADSAGRVTVSSDDALAGCRLKARARGVWYELKLGATPTVDAKLVLSRKGGVPGGVPGGVVGGVVGGVLGGAVASAHGSVAKSASGSATRLVRVKSRSVEASATSGALMDSSRPRPRAGTLTAGAVDDLDNPKAFRRYLQTVPKSIAERDAFGGPHRILQVTDNRGRAVAGATVTLGKRSYRTRRDGRVVLIPGWDPIGGEGQQARVPVGAKRAVLSPLEADVTRVVLDRRIDPPKPSVDLALVVDTTGSMGDELEYLKVELEQLFSTLDEQYDNLDLRWGLVLYRDTHDEYVARSFDFTADFATFAGKLRTQTAGGGGDFPEAVDEAFKRAGQLNWRDAAAAGRVLVHVADAPPHHDKVGDAMEAANALRRAGTSIYPVASSGIDAVAEFTMRSMALMSGGQYVFLTDDSGVGGSHREATEACFKVDKLITVLQKILEAELEGRRASLPRGNRGKGCQKQ